jgi:hypothetical protein
VGVCSEEQQSRNRLNLKDVIDPNDVIEEQSRRHVPASHIAINEPLDILDP